MEDVMAKDLNGAWLALGVAGAVAAAGAVVGRGGSRAKGPNAQGLTAPEMGRYRFVNNCVRSNGEDISAMKQTATEVSRATFARALGPEEWKWIQKELGYDRDFRISGDWHVGYDKGTYRGVPAYWLTHSGIEWIFTLDGYKEDTDDEMGSMAYDSMARIREANKASGGHWFERGAMRFFNTKIEGGPYGGHYFVTSEVGPDGRKAYSVRKADEGGKISTVGDFQSYSTKGAAVTAAKAMGG